MKRRGLVARAIDGRLDRSIVGDLGVVLGCVLVAVGLWERSRPLALVFVGLMVVAGSIIGLLPPKKPTKVA